MTRRGTNEQDGEGDAWRSFIRAHGWRAATHHLAAVVGRTEDEISRLRGTGVVTRLPRANTFPELFALWNGREPTDDDWPAPRKAGHGTYEWQPREVALLATLVGQLSTKDIAAVLTTRLRKLTGDAGAERNAQAVQLRINLIGLQSSDVLGGLTTTAAAREVGSTATVHQSITNGTLKARRVGTRWVIPRDAWEKWKASHVTPPDGFVRLSTLKEPLAIRGDKLSEYARAGHIPGAVRCNPAGHGPSTQFGTWWIDPDCARQMVEDRRAGRPMPWYGKPMIDNLRVTYKLWLSRRHPATCSSCATIWGQPGAPKDFEAYSKRYPALDHGAKRHLTRPWGSGLTVADAAKETGRSAAYVRRAIANGVLAAFTADGATYISRSELTRWKTRKCPTGDSEKCWISLETAGHRYLFSQVELRAHIAAGRLVVKTGTDGAMRGVEYVARHQCALLRESIGFTEAEAARRAGVSIEKLRILLDGANWRGAEGIPLSTLQVVIRRIQSREGFTIEEAASRLELLGATVPWVKARITDGLVKVSRAPWDLRRVYLTNTMVDRLREALLGGFQRRPAPEVPGTWLGLDEAAIEAGVSHTTLRRWSDEGSLARIRHDQRLPYHRDAVRDRARTHWATCRLKRPALPAWLVDETRGGRSTR